MNTMLMERPTSARGSAESWSLTAPARPEIELSPAEIHECLGVYRPESIFITSGRLEDGKLVTTFRTFPYPHSRKLTRHFTRTHAVEFVTQASYLLVANLPSLESSWPLSKCEFLRLADDEQATFTEMVIRFQRFIKNRDGIELQLWLKQFRRLGASLHFTLGFSFPEGCSGTCNALIALDERLKPGAEM